MAWSRTLDVFYRGDRDYIQGSLVISRAVARWKADSDPQGRADLTGASFTRLLDGHYRIFDEEAAGGVDGKIVLAPGDGPRAVLFIASDPERPDPPEREADSPSLLTGFRRLDDGTGEASFSHGGGLDAFLPALIEANKCWHVETYAGARDIWFLSLFDTALPLDDGFYRPAGRFEIENRTVQTMRGRRMTINRIRLVQDGGEETVLSLVFSFGEGER